MRNFDRMLTPPNWLRLVRNFAKTRFRRSPTFHFPTPQNFFSGFVWSTTKVVRRFRKNYEEPHNNGRHLQILHEKLRGLTIFQLHTTLDASSRQTNRIRASTFVRICDVGSGVRDRNDQG